MQATYGSALNFSKGTLPGSSQRQLAEVVEPLASYVCAADRPTEALRRVVAKLLEEVQATNAAAVRYFHVMSPQSFDLAA